MDIEALRKCIDLRALAEEAGAVFWGNDSSVCPLHPGADNPSAFHIYAGRDGHQRWHCFTRCPEGKNDGDAISFYMRWRNVDFKTAVRELMQRTESDLWDADRGQRRAPSLSVSHASTPEPPGDQWQARSQAFLRYAQETLWSPAGEAALAYLRGGRGLTGDSTNAWGLGYNPGDVWDEPTRWGLEGKLIWLPQGIVIPGMRDGVAWYIKVRRPIPGDGLAQAVGAVRRLSQVKYGGPRGGHATLFGADSLGGLPILILTEGEFDAILTWQEAGDLCDVATLGGAGHHLNAHDAVELLRAWVVLVVYDIDHAGLSGRAYLQSVSRRVMVVEPLAHDLTAYWQQGGNLRTWIASLVSEQMERLLDGLDEQQHSELFVRWLEVYERALVAQER
jgi:hypothetical protein